MKRCILGGLSMPAEGVSPVAFLKGHLNGETYVQTSEKCFFTIGGKTRDITRHGYERHQSMSSSCKKGTKSIHKIRVIYCLGQRKVHS